MERRVVIGSGQRPPPLTAVAQTTPRGGTNGANMQLRNATIADAQDLLAWRNDSSARAMSVNAEVIAYDRHIAWLTAALGDPDIALFIAESDAGKIGVCRFDATPDGDAAEVSINLNPAFRGRGLAQRVLLTGIALYSHHRALPLKARIKAGNAPSAAIFGKAGFAPISQSGSFIFYARPKGAMNFLRVDENFIEILYDLLKSRQHTISHHRLPDFEAHAAFVRRQPYLHWFLVVRERPIGAFYIQDDNSVGINIDPPTIGGVQAILAFVRTRFTPQPAQASKIAPDFFVNVPASHQEMQTIMTQLGCTPLQIAYRPP